MLIFNSVGLFGAVMFIFCWIMIYPQSYIDKLPMLHLDGSNSAHLELISMHQQWNERLRFTNRVSESLGILVVIWWLITTAIFAINVFFIARVKEDDQNDEEDFQNIIHHS